MYKILDIRHRNSKDILEFLQSCQKHLEKGYPIITNENIQEEFLPPDVEGLNHGVIWIPTNNDSEEKLVPTEVNRILQDLKGSPLVTILYRFDRDAELCHSIKHLNKNLHGPYDAYNFNGKESEVILYVTSYSLNIKTLARARRLLVIITKGKLWNESSKNYKAMNEVVKKHLSFKMYAQYQYYQGHQTRVVGRHQYLRIYRI